VNKKQETYIASWFSGADLERWTPGRYEVTETTVQELASGRVMVSRLYFARNLSVGRYECIVIGKRLGVEKVSAHTAHR